MRNQPQRGLSDDAEHAFATDHEADEIEAIWKDLFFATHATAVGAITALALAAIDTALWDSRGQRS